MADELTSTPRVGIGRSARRNADGDSWPISSPSSACCGSDPGKRAAARVRLLLERAGTPIGPLDTLIAGTALHHHATLVTKDNGGGSCQLFHQPVGVAAGHARQDKALEVEDQYSTTPRRKYRPNMVGDVAASFRRARSRPFCPPPARRLALLAEQ
jgi:hypothetical protein